MSFEPNALFLAILLGFVGLALFLYGRRTARMPHLVAGLLFMVYPYFTSTIEWTFGVGVLIGLGLWWAVRMGW